MDATSETVKPLALAAHCQHAMNAWCNLKTAIGAYYNASRCDIDCPELLHPQNHFTAKLINHKYHCVHDVRMTDTSDACVCSRDLELRRVLCDCDPSRCDALVSHLRPPDDPPAGAGDCVRDLGNSTRLYNVEVDPGRWTDVRICFS